MIRITTLGSSSLTGPDGQEIAPILAQPKRFALLVYLVLASPGEFHQRDKLVGLFWPELDQNRARGSLRQALSFLRKHLGSDVVLRRGDEAVSLNAEEVWCDAVEFQQQVGAGDFQKGLDLYRGHLLEGHYLPSSFGFEEWLEEERVRLREQAAYAAWSQAHLLIGSGKPIKAERTAQKALSFVPSDETPVRRFVEDLASAGDRGAAIRFYERFAAGLAERYELEPGAETRALIDDIRASVEVPLVDRPEPVVVETTPAESSDARPSDPAGPAGPEATASRPPVGPRPGRVRALAYAGAVLLGLATIAVFTALWPSSEADPAPYEGRVAVLEFENETGVESLDPFGRDAATFVEASLIRAGVARVVPLQTQTVEGMEVLRTQAPLDAAEAQQAEIVITGEYYRRGQEVELVAHLTLPREDENITSIRGIRGPTEEPIDAFEELSRKINAAVAAYYEREFFFSPTENRGSPPSLKIHRLHVEARELFTRNKYREALELHARISELDPTWLGHLMSQAFTFLRLGENAKGDSVAAVLDSRRDELSEMDQLWLDYFQQRGDREAQYRTIQELARLDHMNLRYISMEACSWTNRLSEALEFYSRMDSSSAVARTWIQNWVPFNTVPTGVLARLGRYEDALELAREGRSIYTDSVEPWAWEAQLLATMGRRGDLAVLVNEARGHPRVAEGWLPADLWKAAAQVAAGVGRTDDAAHYAELALEGARGATGDTRSLRARALTYAERWDEAEPLLRELLEEDPESLPFLGHLGWVLGRAGKEEQADRIRDRLEALDLDSAFPGEALYWQAAISTALGQHDRAINELTRATTSGLRFQEWTIWHPWFSPLHDHPRYQRLVAPK